MWNFCTLLCRESNLGLVKQVLASLYKKNIQRLTKTFLTLSLSDVASRVQLSGPSDAEKYILNMVSLIFSGTALYHNLYALWWVLWSGFKILFFQVIEVNFLMLHKVHKMKAQFWGLLFIMLLHPWNCPVEFGGICYGKSVPEVATFTVLTWT